MADKDIRRSPQGLIRTLPQSDCTVQYAGAASTALCVVFPEIRGQRAPELAARVLRLCERVGEWLRADTPELRGHD